MQFRDILVGALATLGLFACEQDPTRDADVKAPSPLAAPPGPLLPAAEPARDPSPSEPVKEAREAHASFTSVQGVTLRGEAELEETAGGVAIEVEVDAGPVGKKGIHVHEKGDCSNIAGKSMGSHFAPDHKDHGLPPTAARHLGDLGNIEIDATGKGKLKLVVAGANLMPGDSHSFLGRSIVIHTTTDQGAGDPSGKSGQPIACAIIQLDQN